MKTLILQHTKTCPAGSTLEWLESRQLDFEISFLPEVSKFPEVSDFDFLVICGGGMNVDEEDQYSWLAPEKKLIRQAIDSQKKVVGLCLGAQLMAEVLGAKVGPHVAWEAGWHPVRFNDGKEMHVFEWHGYSFAIPPGAEQIATNETCPSQAFRYGKSAIGFQFHPEATQEWIEARVDDPKGPREGFIQTKEEILSQMKYRDVMQDWYFQSLDQLTGLTSK